MIKSIKLFIKGENPKLLLWIFPMAFVLIYLFIPWLMTRDFPVSISYQNTGQIGDTIGGLSSPVIALIASLLTYLAFWAQYKSNLEQTKQFAKQDLNEEIGRFENKFYKLIESHRKNIEEIKITSDISGREVFPLIYNEIALAYKAFNLHKGYTKYSGIFPKDEEIMNIVFTTIFLGIKSNSISLLKSLLPQNSNELLDDYIKELDSFRKFYIKSTGKIQKDNSAYSNNFYSPIRPFDGYLNKLEHYYRHLFLIYKLLDSQSEKLNLNKYEYGKIIRSQLSSYEQLILYFNIQSKIGKKWIENGYLEKYKVIKNMPIPLVNFGISPRIFLENNGINSQRFFEWDELS